MIYTLTLNPAIDHTIYVQELNEEDVTRVKKTIKEAAGKGINVSKVLKQLSQKSISLGYIAGENGRFITNELGLLEIPHHFVEVSGESRENIKLICLNSHKKYELNESGPNIHSIDEKKLIDELENTLKKNDILVVSGSLPKGVEKSFYRKILNKHKDVFTILDVSGDGFKEGILGIPNLIKPNLYELEEYVGYTLQTEKQIIEECKKIVSLGIEHVIVTLSGDGAIYVSNERMYRIVTPEVKVRSTIGAGDSFVAGLTYGFQHRFSIKKTLQYAASVATASVLSEKTADVDPSILNELFYLVKIEEI